MNIISYFQAHSDPEIWGALAVNIFDHPNLLSQLGLLALNSCNVAAKALAQIPPFIGHGSQTLLSGLGMLYLNFYTETIEKGLGDFKRAWEVREVWGMVLTALKTLVAATDLLLTCTAFGAAAAALLGYAPFALACFAATYPLALASVFLAMGFQLSDYFANESLLTQMKEITSSDLRVKRVFQAYREALAPQGAGEAPSLDPEDQLFTARVIRQLNPYILHKSIELLHDVQEASTSDLHHTIFQDIRTDIETTHLATKGSLEMIIFNYCCSALSKIYRGTLLDAAVQLLCCSLYTGKVAFTEYDLVEKERRNEWVRHAVFS